MAYSAITTRMVRLLVIGALVMSVLVGGAGTAGAALSLQVTTTEDVVNPGDGELSLREAVQQVSAQGGSGHVIDVPAGDYLLDDGVLLFLTLDPDPLGVTVRGAGRDATVVDAQGLSRVLHLYDAGVTIQDLTVTGGFAGGDAPWGAGVLYDGPAADLRIERVRLTGNTVRRDGDDTVNASGAAIGVDPGALDPSARVELVDSLVDGNHAEHTHPDGLATRVAVHLLAESTLVQRTRVTGTHVDAPAIGSIAHAAGIELVVDALTVDGSTHPPGVVPLAGAGLGGRYAEISNLTVSDGETGLVASVLSDGEMDLRHVTARGTDLGAQLYADASELTMTNSVLVGSEGACVMLKGSTGVSSGGGNVLSGTYETATATTCTLDPTDVVDPDTGLGILDTSATPVPVIPLLPGSPALDHGVSTDVDADARGVARPQGTSPDAGAFEHRGPTASDDAAAAVEGQVIVVDVLANDDAGDAALDPGSLRVVAGPASGQASGTPDGIAVVPGAEGDDTVTYEVCQVGFTSQCDTATLQLDVAGAPGPQFDPGVSRLEGTDRFETAAAVSRAGFDPGLDVVFLATGVDFPDALAGGPLAAHLGAPILLTSSSGLPEATATELSRLQPGMVIALGGPAVVSEDTLAAAAVSAGGAAMDRYAGTNRYETAAEIARQLPPSDRAFLATGANFPDALAAGPVTDGAPILLASGSGLPDATAEVLGERAPEVVVAVGGTGVVAEATLVDAAAASGGGTLTDRLSGTNRYETAVAIAGLAESTEVVFVATGTNFPDALAAAPVAAAVGAGIVLTPSDQLASATQAYLDQVDPVSIVVLGGPGAVDQAVLDAL